ncbi:short-chain dehydrogenase [Stenotrophomonas ginsengisoli]|uniref:Short-chain dehydrogenase n=1 Tax=Stenotrophomonas ginsengisoli TaxID=336566 RepID=A0A0R0D650_9GAMM|nr:SDR family NAD(P)-dependent oxidoreductase [Stenotrophomonas ginsengisoli]KRG77769.1 short-chain dehydrogenase [Stenotrophomonas ginsengisoli]
MSSLTARRIALVTGASSAIGAAICRQLAEEGCQVIAADVNLSGAQAVALSLGERVKPVMLDVTDPDAVAACIGQILKQYGRLDLAVNNAGVAGIGLDTGEYPLDEWHRVLGVNLHGVFYCMKYQLKAMQAQGGGIIVNMASMLGPEACWGGSAAYVAARHALVGMTQSAAREHASQGIRINAVGPGFIQTPTLAAIKPDDYAAMVGLHPAGRLGNASEVAELTCFLLSERASFINGSYYVIDGGYSAR